MSKEFVFSIELKKLRAKTGLSQFNFSELVGISSRTLQNWEIDRTIPDNAHLLLAGMKSLIKENLK